MNEIMSLKKDYFSFKVILSCLTEIQVRYFQKLRIFSKNLYNLHEKTGNRLFCRRQEDADKSL